MPKRSTVVTPVRLVPIVRTVESLANTWYKVIEHDGPTVLLEMSTGEREIWTSKHNKLKSYAVLIDGVEFEFVKDLGKPSKRGEAYKKVGEQVA